jgi:tetratricopeptide (TPR) repeat protein
VELQDDLPGAHALLGTALLAQGFAADAVLHLRKGHEEDLLGVALLESGSVREALDRLEAALAHRPNDPDLLYYLSHAHEQLSKQIFETLQQKHPDSARTHQITAEALASSGNRERAEKYFRLALSSRADLRGVHFALGELVLQAGDYAGAEREFRAELELSPGSAAAAYKLGSVLANQGRTEEAIAQLRLADRLQRDMPETLLELGKTLNAAGDAISAEPVLRRLLTLETAGALAETAHFQLAQAYRKLGRAADAEREMKLFNKLRGARRNN